MVAIGCGLKPDVHTSWEVHAEMPAKIPTSPAIAGFDRPSALSLGAFKYELRESSGGW